MGAEVAKERHAVLLRDGDTWVWKHEDDLKHKHARMVKRHALPTNPTRPPHPLALGCSTPPRLITYPGRPTNASGFSS